MAVMTGDGRNRNIKDFFKAYTVPKQHVPIHDVVEEEIVLAAPRRSPIRIVEATATPAPPKRAASGGEPHGSGNSSLVSSTASTPTKASPSELDGAADDSLLHISPPDSRRHSMAAVALPSPELKSGETKPNEDIGRRPTISFTSIASSGLSSAPPSTQATSSSKRIVRDGIYAVTNSESGSDSDELADPATFVPRKKRKLTPPGTSAVNAIEIPSTIKPSTRQNRGSLEKSGHTPGLPPSPPRTVYKHSLLQLVKLNEKRERSDARVAEVEAALAESERRRAEHAAATTLVDGETVAAMADDSDEADRMMMAMDRTGALEDEPSFRFFIDGAPQAKDEAFPFEILEGLPKQRWVKLLQNDQSRIQACLTGFVAELAARGHIPTKVVHWFACQLLNERREDLCESYVEIVRASTANPSSLDSSLSCLDTFYETVRRTQQQTEDKMASTASSPRTTLQTTLPRLGLVMRVIQHCAPLGGIRSTCQAIADLTFATLDERVQDDAALRTIADQVRASLLQAIAPEMLQEAYASVRELLFGSDDRLPPVLQYMLIASLPASSPRTHELRRRLALHIVLHDSRTAADLFSPVTGEAVLKSLKSGPKFIVSESSDYTRLLHLTSVLDIAIDAGFSDFSFLSAAPSKSNTAFFTKAPPASDAEMAFNVQIDAFVKQMKLMASRIKDAGTSHLRRTEAKSALERLIVRLECTVRTRPKPKHGVFGGGLGEQRSFLESFVGLAGGGKVVDKRKAAAKVVPGVDIMDESKLGAVDDGVELGASTVTEQALSGRRGASEGQDAVNGAEAEEPTDGTNLIGDDAEV